MDFSIIIPVYNERHKIPDDIAGAGAFLSASYSQSEIIIADDGSTDGTGDIARAMIPPQNVALKVMKNERRRGKGFAVRSGMRLRKRQEQGHTGRERSALPKG